MATEIRLPELHILPKVRDRVLWILAHVKDEGYLSAREIAKQLTDVHKISTKPDAVRKALERAPKGFIHIKAGGGEKHYAIMRMGQEYLAGVGSPRIFLIEPERAYTSRRRVEELFKGWTGVVKICDPYVDPKFLDPLTAIPKGSEIKVLTCNVHEHDRVRREIEAYRKEYSKLEVRVCRDKLHDRYVITRDKLWLLGHSLNGLGKKEAFIVDLGIDIRSQMEAVFDRRWATSALL